MIEKIDIADFGSFRDFVWHDSVCNNNGKALRFRRLNILYGRNYSGKTTLSRIFRSLQEQRFPEKYKTPRFMITTDSAGIIDQDLIDSHDLTIRVYNKDFVKDHLSFLRDHRGDITPFAIIGHGKRRIKEQIKQLESRLGSAEEKKGLRYSMQGLEADFAAKQKAANKADDDLETKLRNKAIKRPGGIKYNPIYKDPNYNIRKIRADIKTVRENALEPLDEGHKQGLKQLLEETPLPDINEKLEFSPRIVGLYDNAKDLLTKRIAPTQPIQDLLNDAALQAWVRNGIGHHKNKRNTCGFCGQTLPADLWDRLDAHFSGESEKLVTDIKRLIAAVEDEISRADSIFTLKEKDFYAAFWSRIKQNRGDLDKEIEKYVSQLNGVKAALVARRDNVFSIPELPELNDNTTRVKNHIDAINNEIIANNRRTATLEDEQKAARTQLRLSEVAQFIIDIDLPGTEEHIAELKKIADKAKEELGEMSQNIQDIEEQIQALRVQLKDESGGAAKANEYLNHSFGTKRLRLEAVDDPDNGANFKILRNGKPAYNLSEGECSLVAFCYFLAKLEEAETKGKDLIIFIDDPVSSLDSNHIFFIFSLIESVLAQSYRRSDGSKAYRYHQMFIATHNLDFLKYLKRLSRPKDELAHFIVEGCAGTSRLVPMPKYLRKYITEFNYLFSQIYKCRDAKNVKDNHGCFYNFGNNLRKFLEAYLFYRYPHSGGFKSKMKMFFGEDQTATALATRIGHELSHLEETIDRGGRPIDIPEIPVLANFVLNKMYEKDPDQYNALLKSIGEPPREE